MSSNDDRATRRYHHGDLRAALIDAGLAATRNGGPAALGLRELTRELGVSPNAAYRHFADRQALLDAVADEILARLGRQMTPPAPVTTNPGRAALERLRAVGLGYIQFSRREPGWFQVVFFGPALPASPAGAATRDAPPYRALRDALDTLVAVGMLDARRRDGAQWLCWAAVHGFADLVLNGPLRDVAAAEVDNLAERTVDAIIAGVIRPVEAE